MSGEWSEGVEVLFEELGEKAEKEDCSLGKFFNVFMKNVGEVVRAYSYYRSGDTDLNDLEEELKMQIPLLVRSALDFLAAIERIKGSDEK